jgi:hypothetical protein
VKPRRIIAGVLVVLGALLMFAAPETESFSGAIVMGLGVLLEITGIALERRRRV